MTDRELEKLLLTGTGQPMVAIPGPNNSMQQVTVDEGNFFMLQQVAFQLQQVNIRLEALHQHVRVKEHPRSAGRSTCPMCISMDQIKEGTPVMDTPDPEGDVKEDIEKAKAAEESQEKIDRDSTGEV
jgi:hypothetical protein